MMKYTYCHDIQGNDRSSHYLKMCFDRSLSSEGFYRREADKAPKKIKELLEAIERTPNVLRVDPDMVGNPGLINVNGCEIVAKIVVPVGKVRVAEIASQIAKKVQRRFAKGESRKRVLHSVIEAKRVANNLKTWGTTGNTRA